MGPVWIVTDSTSDLPPGFLGAPDLSVVALNVVFGDEALRDGVDIQAPEFYRRLRGTTELVKTSQPSLDAFIEAYERVPEDREIVSVHISAKLSGTANAARMAAETLALGKRVRIVDSQNVSIGLGAMVIAALRQAAAGADAESIAARVTGMRSRVHVYTMVDTLEYLRRGGRIGRVSSIVGSLLSIKPIIRVVDGELASFDRVRTRNAAIDRLVEVALSHQDVEQVFVASGDADAEAERLARRLEADFPGVPVVMTTIGPTVGVHSGPGVIGICLVERL